MPCPMRSCSTWPARLAWGLLFLHLLLSPVVFCEATSEVFEFSKVALLTLTALALVVLTAPAWTAELCRWAAGPAYRRAGAWLASEPLCAGVLLLAGSAGISTLHSVSPRTSFWGTPESDAGLYVMLAYAILFFATRALCRTRASGQRLLVASVLGGGIAALYAVVQMAHADPIRWTEYSTLGSYARPFGTLGHANLLGAYLVMVWPVTVYLARQAVERRAWVRAVGLGSLALVMLIALVGCVSRGAWLAFACALGWLLLGWLPRVRRRLVLGWLTVGLAACALAVFGAGYLLRGPGGWTPVVERLTHFTESPRLYLWRAGYAIFRDHPLVGCGLDTFQLAFPGKSTPAYWQIEWGTTPAKVHNEWLQTLATQGLLGGLALALLSWGILRTGWRLWRGADPEHRQWLAVLFAALVGFAVQALFSFTVAATGTLFVTLAALLAGLVARQTPAEQAEAAPTGPRVFRWMLSAVAGAGACLAAWFLVVAPFRANLAYVRGRTLMPTDPVQALKETERAVAAAPSQALYWSQLGTAARTCWMAAPLASRRSYLLQARTAWQRACALVPADPYHHANLGCLLVDLVQEHLARPEEALAELDRALELAPCNAYFAIEAADGALALGDLARADLDSRRCADQYPSFGPALARCGFVAFARKQWLPARRVLEAALQQPWQEDQPGRERSQVLLALVLCHLGQLREALEQASGPSADSAEWVSARLIRAQVLDRLGEAAEAAADYRRVLAAEPDNVLAKQALLHLSQKR